MKKTTGSSATRFVYDEAGRLWGEYDAAGTLIQEFVWLDDLPVAVLRDNGSGGTNVFYVHPDHLGTPRAITRASDNQFVWKWDNTEAFGNAAPNENPSGLGTFAFNLRFPGQYWDSETGTAYNYFRTYDASIGRYIQSDPIGLFGGINTYAYVKGQPLKLIDPLGLDGRGGGGEGGDGPADFIACPLVAQSLIGLNVVGPFVLTKWACVYDCNMSCPKQEKFFVVQIQTSITPPLRFGCDSRTVRPFPLPGF